MWFSYLFFGYIYNFGLDAVCFKELYVQCERIATDGLYELKY